MRTAHTLLFIILATKLCAMLPTDLAVFRKAEDKATICILGNTILYSHEIHAVRLTGPSKKNTQYLARFAVFPILINFRGESVLAARELNPAISVNSGKIEDLHYANPSGRRAKLPSDMESGGAYFFNVSWENEKIPEEITIVFMLNNKASCPLDNGSVLIYTLSSDGIYENQDTNYKLGVFTSSDYKLKISSTSANIALDSSGYYHSIEPTISIKRDLCAVHCEIEREEEVNPPSQP